MIELVPGETDISITGRQECQYQDCQKGNDEYKAKEIQAHGNPSQV